MSVSAEQAEVVLAEADCLHSAEDVEVALDRMASQIRTKLEGSDPLVLCVMTGAVIPAGHLLTRLNFPLQVDYIHASRYGNATTGGKLEWKVKPSCSLKGRTILIVDDILDEGWTLAGIVDYCHEQGAKEIYVAAFVEKLHQRKHGIEADFIGLEVEDRYVFGFGMDYKGYLRNLPGIYAVKGL